MQPIELDEKPAEVTAQGGSEVDYQAGCCEAVRGQGEAGVRTLIRSVRLKRVVLLEDY